MRRHLLATVLMAVALVLFAAPVRSIAAVGPAAADDSYLVDHGMTLNVAAPGVLANDTDPDGLPLSISYYLGAGHGTVLMWDDGAFSYTPNEGWAGMDSFVYWMTNGVVELSATVWIQTRNETPVAANDSYSMHAGGSLSVAAPGVLGNDYDVDGDALTAIIATEPAHGTVVLNADGSFVYTPSFPYVGPDGFEYWLADPYGSYGWGVVGIDVQNTAPAVTPKSFEVNQDETLSVPAPGVFEGASDPEGDPLFAFVATWPAHGTLVLDEFFGGFTYTPDAGYYGPDSFEFFVSDFWEISTVETVSIDVKQVNLPPAAEDDLLYAVPAGETLVVGAPGVLFNDWDPEG